MSHLKGSLPASNESPHVRRWFISRAEHFTDEGGALFAVVCKELLLLGNSHVALVHKFSESDINLFNHVLQRLAEHEPIQYIIGHVDFMGLRLKVDKRALIPRPETEELAHMIIQENKGSKLRVADLCTGSGCLALAMVSHLADPIVFGADLSDEAIELAKENAMQTGLNVDFQNFDVLTGKWPFGKVDIILSNPPYVLQNEASKMEPRVLYHEPHMALFVPDTNPLLFYNAISKLAVNNLKIGGKLYFECNQNQTRQVVELLNFHRLNNVTEIKDLSGNQRFVVAQKTN